MSTKVVQVCPEASVTHETSEVDGHTVDVIGCSVSPAWGEVSDGLLPDLSIGDATAIFLAIGALWATAWGYRELGRGK